MTKAEFIKRAEFALKGDHPPPASSDLIDSLIYRAAATISDEIEPLELVECDKRFFEVYRHIDEYYFIRKFKIYDDNNGITAMINTFKGDPLFQIVYSPLTERSRAAQLAAKLMGE